jgi:hypothetical protein
MSLVNDALKRAKDAQQKSPPSASGPQFRLPDPASQPKRGIGMTVPLVIALFAMAGLAFVWLNQRKVSARKAAVEAKPSAPVVAAPVVATPVTKPSTQVTVATPAAPVAPTPAPVVAPVSPAIAPVPELKLQAIFFSPGHSSAIISGKTVRVGNTLKGFRVAAITEVSATLVSATQTNVMTLEQ